MQRRRLTIVAIVAILGWSSSLDAQSSGLFGNGNSGTSGSGSSRTGGGTSEIANQANLGLQGLAAPNQTGGGRISDSALINQPQQNSFVGRGGANGAQQGFVGVDQAATGQQGGLGGANPFGALFGGQGQGGQLFNFIMPQQGQQQQNARIFRMQLDVGFEPPKLAASTVNDRVQKSLNRSLPAGIRPGVEIEIVDRTAVLRGVVPTAHDRAVAEQLALLEPGISRVTNELTVTEPN
jgi:hypothetical protein